LEYLEGITRIMGKIVNFHKVTDIKWFEDVVCMLSHVYSIISGKQLIDFYYNDIPLPRRSLLITVDDGDLTSYDIIYPILKKHMIPAIFFVSPEKLLRDGEHRNFWFQEARHCNDGGLLMNQVHSSKMTINEIWNRINDYKREHGIGELKDQNMTLEQALEIDSEGIVAIGAHTLDHPFLAREKDENSAYEIQMSISRLEKLLGHEVLFFAYPNGKPQEDFGEREINTLRHTTCRLAFSTEPRNFTKSDNSYAIPRYGLSNGRMGFILIKLLLGSKYRKIRRILKSIN
jgi:peptidoglycan/xylan/chitin deacetylase (PgdA/CDA1 family)